MSLSVHVESIHVGVVELQEVTKKGKLALQRRGGHRVKIPKERRFSRVRDKSEQSKRQHGVVKRTF